ncbi:MAG: hypothetical protein QNK64_09220 [Saprospiraceae bacterium]|jgi:hypothetical protein|nr:hypothetical protein [Saprospiraceae bacterium]MDA9358762.1 hypothetical protein [Saprospiraceae bacterium]MDB4163028.1 hypothetical protein [Saprospiraceae bacterium]MDC1309051.1 hypothetical protein [Saprospiraceae bacterium]|tara:strand:- start:78 stop:1232 length:1155 start_codon:yes stop_codon:yes gene_type:complete
MFLYGQQEVTIDDIVAKVYEQNTESTADTYKLPWIEELNVRSETRDWKLRKQSYSLRLRPVSLGERRASSQLYNSWQQELVYLKLDEVYDQVADIHELWIDQDFISRQIELKKQIVALLSDVEKVNTKQSLIDANKLSLLLAVKSRIAKINNGIILDQKRRDDKLRAISGQVQGDYILEADSIDVKGYIQSAKESLLATNRPYISNSDMLDLQVLRNEMELEKAENNRVLDFVSLEYRGPHDNYLEERLSLGMSFNLPFFNGNQLSIAKIKVEQEQEQYKIEKVKQESLAKLTEIKESIFSNVYEYDSYNKLYSKIEAENLQLISNMERQAIINPSIKLNHRIQVIENKLSLLKIQESIVKNYLEYLKATDKYIIGISSMSTAK